MKKTAAVIVIVLGLIGIFGWQMAKKLSMQHNSQSSIQGPRLPKELEVQNQQKIKNMPGSYIAEADNIVQEINSNSQVVVLNSSLYIPRKDFLEATKELPGLLVREFAEEGLKDGRLDKELDKRNVKRRRDFDVQEWIKSMQARNLSMRFVKATSSPVVMEYAEATRAKDTKNLPLTKKSINRMFMGTNATKGESVAIHIPIVGSDARISTATLFASEVEGKFFLEQYMEVENGTEIFPPGTFANNAFVAGRSKI